MQTHASSDMVRLATVGSVDDGKSTLIGRLLYDCQHLLEDQLASLKLASARRGHDGLDLSLITDGLRAEREQGITIDVAYRYFSTPRRTFILADTPGHVQYTRNMVTGASTADVAILLVDAKRGLTEQARRHAYVSSLLGVRHLLICVNKMDLVNYSQERFDELRGEFGRFADGLDVGELVFVPVSALRGDNVVVRSPNMPWYEGPSLLSYLETVPVAGDPNLADLRVPIQYVVRTPGVHGAEGRWYAGVVASGILRVGDSVTILPTGLRSRVTGLAAGEELDEIYPPMSVRVALADDIDVSRGDMFVHPSSPPAIGKDLDIMLCSLSTNPIMPGARVVIQHTTRAIIGTIAQIKYRIDVNTLEQDASAQELGFNEMGRVVVRASAPLFYDSYRRNRVTGGLILVDEVSNATIAAGMIVDSESPAAS